MMVTGTAKPLGFAGPTYEPKADNRRLTGQTLRIFALMRDARWRTLSEIANITGDPEASISAQLRFLTTPEFGSHRKEKRIRGEKTRGLFEYRLVVNPDVGGMSNEDETDHAGSRNLTGEKPASALAARPRSGWLVSWRVKLDILRLWERAIELGLEETELRELLGGYGCKSRSRKELTPNQARDFTSELSRMIRARSNHA